MRKVLDVLASAACAALFFGAAASASAGTLDQQQPAISGNGLVISSTQNLAQTFTAGISGGLDQADLGLQTNGSPTADLYVEIRDGSAAGPGSQVLATRIVPPSSVPASPAFVPVAFNPAPPVVAGRQYAIVLYTGGAGGNYYIWWGAGNVYPPGASFWNTTTSPPSGSWTAPPGVDDFGFKTYVVPTPTPANTGQRAAALASCKKRAHKHNWSKQRLRKCRKKANLLPV